MSRGAMYYWNIHSPRPKRFPKGRGGVFSNASPLVATALHCIAVEDIRGATFVLNYHHM